MCYSADLQHEGVQIIVSDCFGAGFDWRQKELKQAVEDRDPKMWEILDWMVNGGAELFNKAQIFDTDVCSFHNSLSSKYDFLSRQYEVIDLQSLLGNPYMSQRGLDLIKSFFDGSLREQVEEERKANKGKKLKMAQTGVVYLLKSGEYYKIGKTKNLPSRLDSLAVGVRVPFDIQLVHSFKSKDYSSAEAGLHKTFEGKRTDGEWFSLSPDDVEFICGLEDGQL